VILALFCLIVAVLVFAYVIKLLRMDRREPPDEGKGWGRWKDPAPRLPKTPKGTGPVPDYVPDEWVFEQFGPPPRLKKAEPKGDDIP
jgi:hypothetical protein